MIEQGSQMEDASFYPIETINHLEENGFFLGVRSFYDSEGEIGKPNYRNILKEIPCYSKFIKSQMGGNYGPADLYIIVEGNCVKKMQYFGDFSAEFTTLGYFDNVYDLSNLIKN